MRPSAQESRRAAESAPGASGELGRGGRASPNPSFYESDFDDDDGGDELEEENFPSETVPRPQTFPIVHEPTSASSPADTPPKPKRTRQLTTPYQAAVRPSGGRRLEHGQMAECAHRVEDRDRLVPERVVFNYER